MEILIAVAAASVFSAAVFILSAVIGSGFLSKAVVTVSEITVTAFISLFPIIFKKFEVFSYAVSVAFAAIEASVYVFAVFLLRRPPDKNNGKKLF